MGWQLTDEVEAYGRHVWDLLALRPADNTVALTVLESVRAGQRWSAEPMLFGWYEDAGRVTGAVSHTPPFSLHLSAVPDDAAGGLVQALLSRGAQVPGVNGSVALVDRFAAVWTEGRPVRAVPGMRMRLYALDSLRPPTSPPPGGARQARPDEVALAQRWWTAFQRETGAPGVGAERLVRDRTAAGLVWLWADDAGRVVSMAARNRTAAGVARVGPVYTSQEHRRLGYGAAVTAACTADALRHDAEQTVLFTDLANPTSNAIYQRIGYRPIGDHAIVSFQNE